MIVITWDVVVMMFNTKTLYKKKLQLHIRSVRNDFLFECMIEILRWRNSKFDN